MNIKPAKISLIAFHLLLTSSLVTSAASTTQSEDTLARLAKQSNQAVAKIEEIQKIKTSLKVISKTDSQIIRSGKITPEIEKNIRSSLRDKLEKSSLRDPGGIDSGGGSIVTTVQGQKGLVDFFTNAPELFGRPESRPRIKIPTEKPFWKWGHWVDKLDFETLDKDRTILEKISSWEQSSPKMANYLKYAYQNIPIYVKNSNLEFTDTRYFIPENLRGQIASFNTVAFYDRENGLLISRPDFENQSYVDQIGLLMKELLRHVQINYNLNFNAEEMQRLNVQILKGPNQGTSLDLFVTSGDNDLLKILYKSLTEIWAVKLFKDASEYSRRHNFNWEIPSVADRKSIISLMDQVASRGMATIDPYELNELKNIYDQLNNVFQSMIVCEIKEKIDDPAYYDAVQGLNMISREANAMAKQLNKR